MTENALIEVRQLPIIAERLRSVKAEIEDAVKEAESLVCTPETVQAVKGRRAELRKQFDALEEQRKAVKNAVLAPYNEFEAVYKECVSDPMKRGDAALKATIDDYELALKKACEANAREYFKELATVGGVEWLTWDKMARLGNIKISMADAAAKNPQKLRELIRSTVELVSFGARQIATMDDAAEIMAEFKTSLDVAAAIVAVQDRKRRIAEEQAAAEARKAEREAQAAAIAKVDAVAPPEVLTPAKEPEKLYTVTFTIKDVTREQAIRVREYLKSEGIKYE